MIDRKVHFYHDNRGQKFRRGNAIVQNTLCRHNSPDCVTTADPDAVTCKVCLASMQSRPCVREGDTVCYHPGQGCMVNIRELAKLPVVRLVMSFTDTRSLLEVEHTKFIEHDGAVTISFAESAVEAHVNRAVR